MFHNSLPAVLNGVSVERSESQVKACNSNGQQYFANRVMIFF